MEFLGLHLQNPRKIRVRPERNPPLRLDPKKGLATLNASNVLGEVTLPLNAPKKTMIMRGQDIYSSQDETTSCPSSRGSEDEVRGEESSEEVYPPQVGDLLMVRRLLGGQSCDLSQS